MTKATIELAHHKLTRKHVQEIAEFLAHSSKWSWIDFQWSIEKDKIKLSEVSPEEFNRLMEEIPKPPPHAISMFPVSKDEEENIEDE